jgi:hypothetical protein
MMCGHTDGQKDGRTALCHKTSIKRRAYKTGKLLSIEPAPQSEPMIYFYFFLILVIKEHPSNLYHNNSGILCVLRFTDNVDNSHREE